MATKKYPTSEIVRRGKEIYDRDIRAKVEPEHRGKLLAVDVDTGDYALGDTSLAALTNLRAKRPDAVAHLIRVGYPTAMRIGGYRGAQGT
jgi:hypothetical protein